MDCTVWILEFNAGYLLLLLAHQRVQMFIDTQIPVDDRRQRRSHLVQRRAFDFVPHGSRQMHRVFLKLCVEALDLLQQLVGADLFALLPPPPERSLRNACLCADSINVLCIRY